MKTTGTMEKTEAITQNAPKDETDMIIWRHMYASMGISLIPVPLLDFAGLTAIQINMVKKLAKAHGIPFSRNKTVNILVSLLGGMFPTFHAAPLAASVIKIVPAMGQVAGAAAMPALAGASTYAIGKVFDRHMQHFASGETTDYEKIKEYHTEMLKQGEEIASEMIKP